MRTILIVLALCLTLTQLSRSQAAQPLNLMPMPVSVQRGTGELVIDSSFSVAITGHTDTRLQRMIEIFLDNLHRQTGIPFAMKVAGPTKASLAIVCNEGTQDGQELGEAEAYNLEVTRAGIKLAAQNALGIHNGLATVLQLVEITANGFAIPAVTIQDTPRFPWRGLMIDVSRHFIPLDVLKRNLDGMAAVKLNVFHWHLSDNQGFRIESKKLPQLQRKGSGELFYTQAEVRDLIEYARERGIRVVPEFDMPGHSTAWFVGYPDLASAPGPYVVEQKWGVFDPAMDPTENRTYKFLDEFIGEMANLFPDQFFHIGGDEVNGKQWDANPKIQAFMRAHDLKDNQDLQAYFNKRVEQIVTKHGKTMVGWDEILRPDLPKTVVIQSWRGQDSLASAAKQDYRGILSSGYYIDLMWPASQHYAVDPMLGGTAGLIAGLIEEQKKLILGGEACMWSEYVSPENIDSRIWPRTAAIAERLWSPQTVTDVPSMYQRLNYVSQELDWLGLTHKSSYGPMLRRIAASDDINPVQTLADVVEPVKDYTREETAGTEATTSTPLNRLVDAARPESDVARLFAESVNEFLTGKASTETKAKIRSELVLWRDNDASFETLAARAFLLKEAIPLSQNLAAAASAGLQALDYIGRREHPSADWKTVQLAIVEQAKKPKAQLLIMVAPPIQKLIEAAAPPAPSQ